MSKIVPISQIDRRAPEAGRIRIGVKTERAMKSIDKLRFTSPNRGVIEEIAARYGGQARPWKDVKANPSDQWEVITPISEVPVYLVPDGVSSWYELWDGGGCARRCDGEIAQVPVGSNDGYEMADVPCICDREGQMACKAVTRLQVILPEIRFTGTWRLESKGWNAQKELPGMFEFIVSMGQRGMLVQAVLGVEKREKMHRGKKKNFVVPRLSVTQTPQELLEPAAAGPALPPVQSAPALPAASVEFVEAELLDDELVAIEADLQADAAYFGLDPHQFVAAMRSYVGAIASASPEQRARLQAAHVKMQAGELAPTGFRPDGGIQWQQ